MIIGHVAGLTQKLKVHFKKYFEDSKYTIYDLDDFTDIIMDDETMSKIMKRYEYNLEKSKSGNMTKIQNRQHLVKTRELNLKINEYWKKKMEYLINEFCNKHSDQSIIFIGHINFYRNIRIFLKLDVITKIFVNLDLDEYAKDTISSNLENYKDDIINGYFDLELLNKTFLIKRRDLVQSIYQKNGYQIKKFDDILLHFDNNLKSDDVPTVLFYASEHLYKNKIPIKPLTAYSDEWIAISSALGNKSIAKGYVEDNHNKPYVEELVENGFQKFNKKVYVYAIINTLMFVPIYSKNYIYKYKSSNVVQIGKTVEFKNASLRLNELGVKMFKYR